jgi:hypothetical protein
VHGIQRTERENDVRMVRLERDQGNKNKDEILTDTARKIKQGTRAGHGRHDNEDQKEEQQCHRSCKHTDQNKSSTTTKVRNFAP